MSTATRHISPFSRDAAPDVALACTIRWEISPRALLASAPAAALLNGEAPRLLAAALVWHLSSSAARAELFVELAGGEHHTIPLTGLIPLTITQDQSQLHIDAPGALHLTLRIAGAAPTILYARTPILDASLALPGGVYEVPTLSA